jgi:thioredoxin 1
MMAPILEDLTETKSDYFEVIFYDVYEDRSKAQEFGIRAIPTQIFFSAQGEELFRHEGYYSRKQILDKWRDLGIDVGE